MILKSTGRGYTCSRLLGIHGAIHEGERILLRQSDAHWLWFSGLIFFLLFLVFIIMKFLLRSTVKMLRMNINYESHQRIPSLSSTHYQQNPMLDCLSGFLWVRWETDCGVESDSSSSSVYILIIMKFLLTVNGDFSNGNMYCSCSTSDPMHKAIGTGNRDERYNIDSKVVYYTNDIDELP